MSLSNRLWALSRTLQRSITPGLRYSQAVYEDALREHVPRATAWLDLGCGHQVLPAWRGDAERELVAQCPCVVGLDYDVDALRAHRSLTLVCRGDVTRLPFPDAAFDLVTANMVVEHLRDPAQQFREIARVLKPGGRFLFHTPNDLCYIVILSRLLPDVVKRSLARLLDGRPGEDVFPTFYRANRASRIRRLVVGSGLEARDIRHIVTSPVFHMLPPLLVPELLWIRLLMRPGMERWRTNLICELRKEPAVAGARPREPSSW